jgi:hypothetical protein
MKNTKPLSEYYKEGEEKFFLEVIQEIEKASKGNFKGRFKRHKDVSCAVFSSEDMGLSDFLVLMDCCRGSDVIVVIRSIKNSIKGLDMVLKIKMERLTVTEVVEPILKLI